MTQTLLLILIINLACVITVFVAESDEHYSLARIARTISEKDFVAECDEQFTPIVARLQRAGAMIKLA